MARPALAELTDLEALMGATIANPEQANARLAQASEIVRAYAGATWLNEGETAVEGVPGQIPGVVAAMVERATRNPEGVTQETTGPFGRSFGSDAASRLFLTSAEKLVVRSAAGRRNIGTLSTTRGCIETPSVIANGGYLPSDSACPDASWAGDV